MSTGQLYVVWSTLCRLVKFYVVWSTLCRLVKFYMSTGQLNVVWSSFICLLVNFHIRSRKADLPFAIRARKRELRLQRYVSRITRTENFRSQNFSKLFLKLLLFMFHATLIIMSRKYFFRFSKFTHTLRYTILDSRAPLVMRSREAGLPFAIRARKRELRLQRYVSRMTRTENLLSQNFSKFFWKLLLFMFHATLIIMSRKYFFRFSKVTYASIHDFGLEGSPCNAISGGRPSLRNTSSEAPEARKLRLQRYVSRMYLQSELTEGCKFD